MTAYCRRQMVPGTILGGRCEGKDGCGHLLAAHVGVDHCPVCELVDLAARQKEAALLEGLMTINQYRAKLGYPPLADTDEPVKLPSEPQVGDIVHRWSDNAKCTAMRVIEVGIYNGKSGMALEYAVNPSRLTCYIAHTHDEQRQTAGSWHWPCDGGEQPAVPEPDAPAPTTITINVQGSVVPGEKEILDVIRRWMLRTANRM